MLQWLGFIIFTVVMLYAFVLVVSEIISNPNGLPLWSMNGQFMIIAPVAAAGPFVADIICLNGAFSELKYGKPGVWIFAVYYFVYVVVGIHCGSALAEKKLREKTTKAEAEIR